MAGREEITAEMIREILDYDPSTGVFTWKKKRHGSMKVPGDRADSKNFIGYMRINVCGYRYLAHRLAWLLVTGEWPKENIDHLDGDRSNNRFSNLRDISQMANIQNQRKSRTEGRLLGVSKNHNKWSATIMAAGKRMYLGNFDTQELAHAAYLEAKRKFHEGCTI